MGNTKTTSRLRVKESITNDGTLTQTGNAVFSGTISGSNTITMFFNEGNAVDAGWNRLGDSTWFIDQNLSAQKLIIPISGLKEGDTLTAFRILGAVGGTGSNATVVDADLRKVTKGVGTVTDASVGAITQQSLEADTSLDVEKDLTDEVVADDFQYYVLVTVTTADNAANDAAITGIEVDVTRLL